MRPAFIALAKKYGLMPLVLRDVILLRLAGRGQTEIAQAIGVNRNTANKYVARLRDMGPDTLVLSRMALCEECERDGDPP
jgi:DNA-binding MarR family transcriptional regulator